MKRLLFTIWAAATAAVMAGPEYQPGCLTAENAAGYLKTAEQAGETPQGFSTELTEVYLDLYPNINAEALDLDGFTRLDPHLAKDRAYVMAWILEEVRDQSAQVLAARALKFDPAKNVREEVARQLARFTQPETVLFSIALDKMQHDLDAEVRKALIKSLGALYARMDDRQASRFRMVLAEMAKEDPGLTVMEAAKAQLTCASEMRRQSG